MGDRSADGIAGTAARLLASRLRRCDREYRQRTDQLPAPFRMQPDGRPPRSGAKHVHRLARDRRRLPRMGRLHCHVEGSVLSKTTIYDHRATPLVAQFPRWETPGEAVRLSVRIFEVAPPHLSDVEAPVLLVPLYALEQHFARADRDEIPPPKSA